MGCFCALPTLESPSGDALLPSGTFFLRLLRTFKESFKQTFSSPVVSKSSSLGNAFSPPGVVSQGSGLLSWDLWSRRSLANKTGLAAQRPSKERRPVIFAFWVIFFRGVTGYYSVLVGVFVAF